MICDLKLETRNLKLPCEIRFAGVENAAGGVVQCDRVGAGQPARGSARAGAGRVTGDDVCGSGLGGGAERVALWRRPRVDGGGIHAGAGASGRPPEPEVRRLAGLAHDLAWSEPAPRHDRI